MQSLAHSHVSRCWARLLIVAVWCIAAAAATAEETPAPYQEALRPQFHFTARENWLNDPNGLVFDKDEYHLFFQHNPFGIEWGNMTWGHAVSRDLVHWRQLDHALEPDEMGTMFSGSAVVDWHNTSGFQQGDDPPLVAIYTAAGGNNEASQGKPFTQAIAYSNDRGRTWTKYAGNPVVKHIVGGNRDPKVIWHEPSRQWVMALYLDGDRFALFASPDLKEWNQLQEVRVPGSIECPDFFELPIEGEEDSKWIFWTANNAYLVGEFDGKTFTDETGPVRSEFGANCFAAQSFSDIPQEDGRRIQIAWMRDGKYPGMPFNQQMSLPTVATLVRYPEGLRLRRRPVDELKSLRGEEFKWSGTLQDNENPLEHVQVDAGEVLMTIDAPEAQSIALDVRGTPLVYDAAAKKLTLPGSEAPLDIQDRPLKLHVFIDRTSIEVFADDGHVTLTQCFLPPADNQSISLSGKGAEVESLQYWPLQSAWKQPPPR